MSPATEPRWVPDALGVEHLVTGEGTRISEHETTRIHMAGCGVVISERVGTSRCAECSYRAHTRQT